MLDTAAVHVFKAAVMACAPRSARGLFWRNDARARACVCVCVAFAVHAPKYASEDLPNAEDVMM